MTFLPRVLRWGSFQHLLRSCSKVLTDGCYPWCHIQVLKATVEAVTTEILSSRYCPRKNNILYLNTAPTLDSDATKQVIMWELTVPWEEHLKEAHERKQGKYLVEECRDRYWLVLCKPIKVGCWGFAGHSTCKGLTRLSVTGAVNRGNFYSTTEAAEEAAQWLWIKTTCPWVSATGTQSGNWSTPDDTPKWGCLMLKPPITSRTWLMIDPSGS